MALDEETIKKRMSQIELDINQMNQMIDENLMEETQETKPVQATESAVTDTAGHAVDELVNKVEEVAGEVQEVGDKEHVVQNAGSLAGSNEEPEVEHETEQEAIHEQEAKEPHEEEVKEEEPKEEELVKEEPKEEEPIKEEPKDAHEEAEVTHEETKDDAEDTHEEAKDANENEQPHQEIPAVHQEVPVTHNEPTATEHKEPQNEQTHESIREPAPQHQTEQQQEQNRVAQVVQEIEQAHTPEKTASPVVVAPEAHHAAAAEDWEDVEDEEDEDSTMDTSTEFDSRQPDTASSVLTAEDIRTATAAAAAATENSTNRSHLGNVTPVTDQEDYNDNIFIPKNHHHTEASDPAQKPAAHTATRRTTNPFRVISVSSPNASTAGSRKSSGFTTTRHVSHGAVGTTSDAELIQKYEQRHENLTRKCTKVQREIDYLEKMNSQGTLNIEDSRKLAKAIEKLQEYLDKKKKERYEVGLLLSRQLRRDINRGDNGEFWVGTK